MRALPLIGRILFGLIFLIAPTAHFSQGTIQYAAAQGVPLAGLVVPLSGVMALLGAVSIILGYRVKIGAALLVLFLVPVTLSMHNFWSVSDPMLYQIQLAMFLKNTALLGGALLIYYFGAGPLSLDARQA